MHCRNLWVLMGAWILLILFVGCAKQPEEKEIKMSKDTIQVVFEGVILPSREEKLIAASAARVSKINVDKARRVAKNQKIVELDQKELEIAYRQALLNYERAKVTSSYHTSAHAPNAVLINNAKERLFRTYELYNSGFASRAELKAAEDDYQRALQSEESYIYSATETDKATKAGRKDVQKAALDVEKAKYNLDHSVITAPFDGYLTDFKLTEGEMVSARETIGKVINIDDVVLKGEFSPGIYRYLKVDMSVNVSCITVPQYQTTGLVKEISPVVDPVTGRLSLYIPLKNQNYLLQPGTKCLITMVMPKAQAEKAGIDTRDDKAYIKSEIRSPDVKPTKPQ